jgi:hypothetical protein
MSTFRKDIANGLAATYTAQLGTVPAELLMMDDPEMREFIVRLVERTRRQTLVSVGLTFGLEPAGPGTQTGQVAGLLWAEAEQ